MIRTPSAAFTLRVVPADGPAWRVRVVLLPTQAAVARAYGGCRALSIRGLAVQAFFAPRGPASRARPDLVGSIVLPADGDLQELVPHEAVHAVMYVLGGVHHTHDEDLARMVGELSGRIHARLAALGYGA